MFDIAKAIKKGNVRQTAEGLFEVWDFVNFTLYDRATQEDVEARQASLVGQCINHQRVTKRCSVLCNSLVPTAKNGDVVLLDGGRWRVFEVQPSGDCHLWPLDRQIVTPHTSARFRYGNVYCLFGDGSVNSVIEGYNPDCHK